MPDAPTPSPEAEDTFAHFLLRRSQGSSRDFEDVIRDHPELEGELRALYSRWSQSELGDSQQSLRERIRAKRGKDLDPGITLEPVDETEPVSSKSGDESSSSSRILNRIRKESDSSRYSINGEIARGGMGAILKVWDEDLRRSLAMKVVLGRGEKEDQVDDGKLARFLEEAQITGQLDHPGVVPVHEIGIGSDGRAFFTMQLVKGRDLKEIFGLVRSASEGWSRTRALNVILRVCEAMAFAHEKQVIHRDLKPANVMVGRFGETYVMDWGLAKVLGREDSHDVRIQPAADQVSLSIVQTDRGDSTRSSESPLVTMDGDIVGTPCYMAPEQARGVLEDIGPHSDVYAVGALLYELLTGFAPYMTSGERLSPVAVLGMVLQGPPTGIEALDKGVPSELIAICEKAMARAPGDRYPSMLDMAEDLRAFLENRVVGAYETGALAEFKKWVGRNKGMAAAVAAAGIAVLLGLGGVAAVQKQANRKLLATNEQLSATRDELSSTNAELGSANDGLREATERALENERESSFLSYSANMAAAASSLVDGDVSETQRRLQLCPEALRGWEWNRLQLETDSSSWSRTFDGREAAFLPFLDADIDPSGERIVLATSWDTVLIVRSDTGETVLEFDHDRAATSLAFSPDGERVVTSASDRKLHVFDAVTGEELNAFRVHRSSVKDIDIATWPDGRNVIASTGIDKYVILTDLDTGEQIAKRKLGSSGLCIQWSPDGTHFATGSLDRTVRLHDGRTAQQVRTYTGHKNAVADIAFDPSGRFLASVALRSLVGSEGRTQSQNGVVLLFDVETGREVQRMTGHNDGIASITFLGDGTLVSASLDGSLRRFDTSTGNSRAFFGHRSYPAYVLAPPGGSYVVTAGEDRSLRGWDLGYATGLELPAHPRAIEDVRATDSGKLVSISRAGMIRVHDGRTGALLRELRDHSPTVLSMTLASEAETLVTIGSKLSSLGQTGNYELAAWDVGTGENLWRTGLGETGFELRITPDGRRVAFATTQGIHVVDGDTGEQLVLLGNEFTINSLDIADDGLSLIASTSNDGTRVFDVEAGTSKLLDPEDPTSNGYLVRLYEDEPRITRVQGSIVRMIHAETGAELAVFQGHSDRIEDLALSPDGTRLATTSQDATLRIWDAERGDMLLSLSRLGGLPTSLTYLPGGERIAIGFNNGRVRLLAANRSEQDAADHREALRIEAAAHRLVTPLFERTVDPEEVERALIDNESLDRRIRDAARVITSLVPTNAQQLEEEAWPVVKTPSSWGRELDLVLWKARFAASLDEEDENAHRMLGLAHFRLGDYEAARAPLERADELRTRARRARPDVAAALAMVNHRLGRTEDAVRHMDRLRGLMSVSVLQSNRDAVSMLAEAERLLAASPEPGD